MPETHIGVLIKQPSMSMSSVDFGASVDLFAEIVAYTFVHENAHLLGLAPEHAELMTNPAVACNRRSDPERLTLRRRRRDQLEHATS